MPRYKGNINVFVIAIFIIATFTKYLTPLVNYALIIISIVYFVFQKINIKDLKPIIFLVIFMIITLIYASFGLGHFDSANMHGIIYTYTILIGSSMIPSVIIATDKKNINRLFWFFIIVLIAGLLATIVIGITDPMAIRRYAFGDVEGSDYVVARKYSGIGLITYSSAHALPLIVAFCIVAVIESKKKIQKAFFVILIIVILYVLGRMIVTTAFLASLLAITIIISYKWTKGKIVKIVGIIFAILFLALIIDIDFLENWASTTDNVRLSAKIMSVIESAETGMAQGQIEGRNFLYKKSINSISNYPIFGGATMTEVGKHSFLLDFFAIYGIFCILLIYGWWRLIRLFQYKLPPKFKVYIFLCLLPIIILLVLKSMVFLPSYFMITLVVLPLCFSWLKFQIQS